MTGRNLCAVVTAAVAAGVLAGYVPVPPIDGPMVALWRHAAGAAPMDEFSPPTEGRPACLVTIAIQARWRPSNRNSSVSARVRVKVDRGRNS